MATGVFRDSARGVFRFRFSTTKATGNEVLLNESELLPPSMKDEADKWQNGTDTMDVWFDSGSSWADAAQTRSELAYPADLYLEGSDQHRGWVQSSLLTSVANNTQAPYKSVLTHGFVLDEKGFKILKSLGNVVDPMQIINGGNNNSNNKNRTSVRCRCASFVGSQLRLFQRYMYRRQHHQADVRELSKAQKHSEIPDWKSCRFRS